MIIVDLEKKMKMVLTISVISFVMCIIIVISTFVFSYKLVDEGKKKIYVLDGSVPVLANRTDLADNIMVEIKSQVNLFHSLFFNLPPDDEFIKEHIERAMYLVDESGVKEYNNLKEKGFYNQIIGNSMVLSIKCDSITLEMNETMPRFIYYGKQRIERPSSILYRKMITTGGIRVVPRTDNNAHGLIITSWKTLRNEDIETKAKRAF